jgi:hypothetical protein
MEGSTWRDELIDRLAKSPRCGYAATDIVATEPSALAALALAGEGRIDGAKQVARWLEHAQSPAGSVGVRENEDMPCWPTSLAIMVWLAAGEVHNGLFANSIQRGLDWILNARGVTMPRDNEPGHDASLEAWPWVVGTHAWVEPTALHVLALKTARYQQHPRTREAVRMLADRQLPQGGFNYGNTFVLDRLLRPHLQPTGLAVLALSNELNPSIDLSKSVRYLETGISSETGTPSLCWSLIALAAQGKTPTDADAWLEAAYHRTLLRDRSPLKLALILLASQGSTSFLVKHCVEPALRVTERVR